MRTLILSFFLLPLAFVAFSAQSHAGGLNSASDFAVLAGSTVTNTGNTVLNGDLGAYPGAAITGFGPGIVNGATYAGGPVAQQAQADALAEYVLIAGKVSIQNLSGQVAVDNVHR